MRPLLSETLPGLDHNFGDSHGGYLSGAVVSGPGAEDGESQGLLLDGAVGGNTHRAQGGTVPGPVRRQVDYCVRGGDGGAVRAGHISVRVESAGEVDAGKVRHRGPQSPGFSRAGRRRRLYALPRRSCVLAVAGLRGLLRENESVCLSNK